MEKITLEVKGMSCGHCVKAVESNVGALNGVEMVKVHLTEGLVDIDFNPDMVTLNQIKDTIDDQGYDVEGERVRA
ncbi:copper chaperone CopZ [Heyndrickxia ginsengihumi]|uniref:Copper chaperone CopZ n=1 Tax=Heyndrickxia ginsengihumi TaxID=363870 RepID=A0A0A6V9P6_9BACI|nr:copper chaperone CopZ [Heyndrickxia ginsengihumi]KHD84930.1 copper resistance protein CopZ [Heyndrickxia ginsengihumi]MBE6184512.1 copper chaperone CopZ [Bacillus sp. (in: firmicutes)]MCM3024785.1 copper chaperone CopZ [Heyndrickxia ginsengihumi]NEY21461.1 copper chaperone CopZ [Heyndrickxia ginsengihumi]